VWKRLKNRLSPISGVKQKFLPPHIALGLFIQQLELSTGLLITWAVMNSYQQGLFFELFSVLFETTISGGPGGLLAQI
jgi:hypothetical protein